MKRWMLLLPLALSLALLAPLALARPAHAGNCTDDHRVMGQNYTLGAGEKLDSNLIVLGGNATIAAGATLNCTLVVMGGNVDVAGSVQEDMVVIGGNVQLRDTAVIGGQLVTFGGVIDRADGAQVIGGESQGFGGNRDGQGGIPFIGASAPILAPVFELYQSVVHAVFTSIGLGLLALLVVLFWPEQTARVGAAITSAPGATGGLGLLTAVAVPMLMLLAAITICLIPLSFVGMVIFTAALVYGWIALGLLVGVRLAGALRLVNLSPAIMAALGTGLLSLVISAISWVPCIGWVAPVVLAAVGLGAVTLTRFGTQAYLPGAPTAPAAPAAPPPADASPMLPAA